MQASHAYLDSLNSKTGKHRAIRNTVNIHPNCGRLTGCGCLHFALPTSLGAECAQKEETKLVGVSD
jgi:hypothetical protein